MKKNILFYYPTPINPESGGVERVTFLLSKFLIEQGYSVYYLHLLPEFDYSTFPLDVKPIFLPETCLMSSANIDYYNQIIGKYHIDIIINQQGLYEGAYFIGTLKKKVRIISVIHNNPIQEYGYLWHSTIRLRNESFIEKLKRIARVILYPKTKFQMHKSILNHYKYLYNHTKTICLLSSQFLPILKRIDESLLKKAFVINNPNTYKTVNNIPSKENIVLYVGRLQNRQKNLTDLISIWRKIKNDKWKLIILGDGPDRTFLEKQSKGCENIVFEGFKDPEPYYQNAKILCLTSIFEGFPMCLTEAMQFGCVPIAFDSFPAVHDVIIPGETGELVKPFNKKEYIYKLTHLMEDDNYRTQLSQKGFEYVKKFDISNILPKWIELINQ